MNRQYGILMTSTAESFYVNLATKVRQENQDGNRIANSSAVLSCIEQAIDEISLTPFDETRSLTGTFSGVYRFCSGLVRIVYTVEPDKGQIVILSICVVQQSLSQFVQMAFESGKLDGLCGMLGIDKTDLEQVSRSAYVN